MRDTIIALLFVSGLAGAYYYLRQSGYVQEYPYQVSEKQNPKASLTSRKKIKQSGATHDANAHLEPNIQSQSHGQDARASVDVAAAEELPSIYESQGTGPGVGTGSANAAPSQSVKQPVKAAARRKQKVIHGVPVDAWVLSRQNALAGPAAADTAGGMRVFLQCMELKKKGPEYVGQNQCEELLAKRSSDPVPDTRAY